MQILAKTIVQILGLFFSVLVLGFTGVQTWNLLYEVTQNALVATLGLVLFEGGMLYWLATFKTDAEGIMQLAISLLLFIFGLLLVGGATALHLGAVSQTLGSQTPARLITIAAILNLLGKTVYPIFAPETFNHVWTRALEGVVMAKAYLAAQSKTDEMAQTLADRVGDNMVRRLTINILTGQQLPHNYGDIAQLPAASTTDTDIIEGETIPRSTHRQPPAANRQQPASGQPPQNVWNAFWHWLLGNQAEPKTQPTPEPAPEPEPAQDDPQATPPSNQPDPHQFLLQTLNTQGQWETKLVLGRFGVAEWRANIWHRDTGDQVRIILGDDVLYELPLPENTPPAPTKSWQLNDLLDQMGMTRAQARETAIRYNLTTPPAAWNRLKAFNYIPDGMTKSDFEHLFNELMAELQGDPQDSPLAPAQAQ